MEVYKGKVCEREIDNGTDIEYINVVKNEFGTFDDVLEDYIGKKVRITIEVIE